MSSSEEVNAAHAGEMPCRRLFALPRSGVAAACGSTQAGADQGDPFRARVTTAGATSGRRRPMRTVPVIDAATGDARDAAAWATSSAVTNRPIGWLARWAAAAELGSSAASGSRPTHAVSAVPGDARSLGFVDEFVKAVEWAGYAIGRSIALSCSARSGCHRTSRQCGRTWPSSWYRTWTRLSQGAVKRWPGLRMGRALACSA